MRVDSWSCAAGPPADPATCDAFAATSIGGKLISWKVLGAIVIAGLLFSWKVATEGPAYSVGCDSFAEDGVGVRSL